MYIVLFLDLSIVFLIYWLPDMGNENCTHLIFSSFLSQPINLYLSFGSTTSYLCGFKYCILISLLSSREEENILDSSLFKMRILVMPPSATPSPVPTSWLLASYNNLHLLLPLKVDNNCKYTIQINKGLFFLWVGSTIGKSETFILLLLPTYYSLLAKKNTMTSPFSKAISWNF